MTDAPPQGQMYLFDAVTPPLDDGSYRLTTETDVTYASHEESFSLQSYFNIVGPRFTVPPAMVAGRFPPNNGHGAFEDDLPHIVLSRRSLPWERELDPDGRIGTPAVADGDPPPMTTPVPWVALLVFEEGEYTLYRNIPLQTIVPADVFTRLGSPANITCDAVEADVDLVKAITPSLEELQLLAHVRWVNVDDRELNAAGGDGYFSVVVANRLPSPSAQCLAVLVSLEQRSDVVPANPPPTAVPIRRVVDETAARLSRAFDVKPAAGVPPVRAETTFALSKSPVHQLGTQSGQLIGYTIESKVRLVALTSWRFTCEGPGTFRELMQGLDDALFGNVASPGHPPLADTGHLQIELQDRLGAQEEVWYRGPLVPYTLTRDANGPYQSADQARRVTPETGAEDISFAAAFEVGRLLAAADPRLAQALMRWRRESYRQSARASTIQSIAARIGVTLPSTLAETLHTPIAPIVATAATAAVIKSGPPIADAYGLTIIANAPGMNPAALAQAWNLASPTVAAALLGADPGTLGAVVTPPATSTRPDTTLGNVAADTAGLARLSTARTLAVNDAITALKAP